MFKRGVNIVVVTLHPRYIVWPRQFTQHTILKDGDRKVLRRIAGQPQTELLVGAFRNNDLLTNLLKFWHP